MVKRHVAVAHTIHRYISWIEKQPEKYNVVRRQLGHHWQAFHKINIKKEVRRTFVETINTPESFYEFLEFCFISSPSDYEYLKAKIRRS